MTMEIIPGRPGVNRIVVRTPEAMVAVDRMELALEDLDKGTSTSVPLVLEGMAGGESMPGMEHTTHVTPNPDGTIDWIAGAIVLPADSHWDASVRILTDDGAELQRQRFSLRARRRRHLRGPGGAPPDVGPRHRARARSSAARSASASGSADSSCRAARISRRGSR